MIDHGFAFRREGDDVNASVLIDWRRRAGPDELTAEEHGAVERLLATTRYSACADTWSGTAQDAVYSPNAARGLSS